MESDVVLGVGIIPKRFLAMSSWRNDGVLG